MAATLSGILLWLAWPVRPTAPLLFLAWVPLLWMESSGRDTPWGGYFIRVFWACLIWNVGTTWWIYHSTAVGSIVAMAANALLMTIPWMLLRATAKMAGSGWGYLGWIVYWCSFEYIHLTWEISWPWLTLGNGFAMFPKWIQWYEFTGVFGGTLWIMLINLALYISIWGTELWRRRSFYLIIAGVLLPIVLSYLRFFTYQEQGEQVEFVVVQPNIDPYTEKFIDSENFISFDQQVARFIQLSDQALTEQTAFLLWPESALDAVYQEQLLLNPRLLEVAPVSSSPELAALSNLVAFKGDHPEISLLTGLTSYRIYGPDEDKPVTARYDGKNYYDVYNTAYFLGNQPAYETYHKSKLVPGPETMPYPKVFGFLSEYLVDFGGTSGQMGKQTERKVFFNSAGVGVAPAICYESIYGDFMARYVRNGANFIGIITNDGWWKNTPGHKQHLHYAVLRAIENRRGVARSANTGISAFIDQKGTILHSTEFWEQDVIREVLRANREKTFYSQHGDYLGRTACWLAILVLLSAWVKKRTLKK